MIVTCHSRRLDKLEEIYAPSGRPERWHTVVGDTDTELDQRMEDMIASGEAQPSDGFVQNLIVSP